MNEVNIDTFTDNKNCYLPYCRRLYCCCHQHYYQLPYFLVVYNIVWATLFATITGIMTIDKRYLDKAATLELTGVKRFMKVILPAASPSILAGFVNSLRSSFVMLVFAEMYGGGSGMGYFVKKEF